jgi:hypothetical protein
MARKRERTQTRVPRKAFDYTAELWRRTAASAERDQRRRQLDAVVRQLGAAFDGLSDWHGKNGKEILLRYAFVECPPRSGETIWSRGSDDYCRRIAQLVHDKTGRHLRPKYVHRVWKGRNKKVPTRGTKNRP